MVDSELFNEISSLLTEQNNPKTKNIDIASTYEILELINDEDKLVPDAVRAEILNIEKAVNLIVEAFKQGGKLYYIGAGTSGRLGIVDASECPPTFGVPFDMVQGIIAGGNDAIFKAKEGAEDKMENGAKEIIERNIFAPDIVCGIAASGRTPYVIGALKEAKKRNIKTIFLTTNTNHKALKHGVEADVTICPQVGSEVIAGSTRMKSGTAQKLVLNMLTTASFIKLGKTYGNVMVDLQLTNKKLKERAKKILMTLADVDYDKATNVLEECGGHVKTALVMLLANVDIVEARKLLNTANSIVKLAIENK
jgi:N-acetylmuramic acid 6-phosphate etherase